MNMGLMHSTWLRMLYTQKTSFETISQAGWPHSGTQSRKCPVERMTGVIFSQFISLERMHAFLQFTQRRCFCSLRPEDNYFKNDIKSAMKYHLLIEKLSGELSWRKRD